MSYAQQLTDPVAEHAEGPLWDAGAGCLRYVDMLRGDLLSIGADGELVPGTVPRSHLTDVLAMWRPRRQGGAVIATEHGFAISATSEHEFVDTVAVIDDSRMRMNEGGCDPQGRLYCGSMAYDETPGAGRLFRLDTDGSVTTVLRDVTISNGMAFSPDGSIIYYIDTPTGRVDAFDFEPELGTFSNRRTAITIDKMHGAPDGMTIDTDGRLWIALWGGAAVRCYEPDGELIEIVYVAARNVTSCTFGGPKWDQLFVTTSRVGIGPTEAGASGAVFTLEPGAQGFAPYAFGG